MNDPVSTLLIEDDSDHAELIQRAFEECGNGARLRVAQTLAQAHAYLRDSRPSLVLADWRLPDGESNTLLTEDGIPALPIIIMTATGGNAMRSRR